MNKSTMLLCGALAAPLLFCTCATEVPTTELDEAQGPAVRDNRPPVILRIETAADTVRVDETLRCACTAEDPDGDSLSYEWAFYKAAEHSTIDNYDFDLHMNRGEVSEEANRAVWTPGRLPGKYILFCKVTDRAGFEVLDKKLIHVTFEGTLHAVTEHVVYQPMDEVLFTIENLQYDRVIFEHCALNVVAHTEQWIDSAWINVTLSFGCAAIGEPIPINLSERYIFVAWTIPSVFESGMVPGVYRLFFKYHFSESGVQLDEVLYSNEFEVTAGPNARNGS